MATGPYVDVGETTINPTQHIAAKQARIFGVSGYVPQLGARVFSLMNKYLTTIPFEKIVTHEFKIEEADRAMKATIEGNSLKVIIVP